MTTKTNTAKKPATATATETTYKVGHAPATRANTLNDNAATWEVLAAHLKAHGPATKKELIEAVQAARGGHGDYVGYAIRRKWLTEA